jgi:glycosyltransferase involved in cell wall biosynthesis
MTEPPEVTVVIPTRDRWPLLAAHALPSALRQEDVVVEVIVVDDRSSDETAAQLVQRSEPRLRFIRHETNRGVAAARNTAIRVARGEWVAFLDDDDLWSPRKLRVQLDNLDGAAWAFAGVIVVDEERRPLYALPLPDPATIASRLMGGNIVPGGSSNVIARTELVRDLGGFDERLSHSADWDLWIRLARAGRPAACRDVLVATLQHPGRMMLRDQPDILREARTLFSKYGKPTRRQLLSVTEWAARAQHGGGHRLRASSLYLRAALAYRSPGNLPPAVGALFGEPGMRIAAGLLRRLRGASHLDSQRLPVPSAPAWLEHHRPTAN